MWIENIKIMNHKCTKILTTEESMYTLKRTDKCKSPGINKMTYFGLHHLSSTNQLITKFISEIVKDEKCLIGSQK